MGVNKIEKETYAYHAERLKYKNAQIGLFVAVVACLVGFFTYFVKFVDYKETTNIHLGVIHHRLDSISYQLANVTAIVKRDSDIHELVSIKQQLGLADKSLANDSVGIALIYAYLRHNIPELDKLNAKSSEGKKHIWGERNGMLGVYCANKAWLPLKIFIGNQKTSIGTIVAPLIAQNAKEEIKNQLAEKTLKGRTNKALNYAVIKKLRAGVYTVKARKDNDTTVFSIGKIVVVYSGHVDPLFR